MTIRLVDLLPQTTFPLYAIHPSKWRGASFIGDVSREQGRVSMVEFVYLTGVGASGSGAGVSNVDPSVRPLEDGETYTDLHLVQFVSRFDPRYVRQHMKPRRSPVFPLKDFRVQEMVLPIGGVSGGVVWLQHRTLPVSLVRTAMRLRDRIVELGIATWNEDARAMAKQVEQVDARFVQEFDAATDPVYPPPDWSDPERAT